MTGDGRIRLPAGAVADGHHLGLTDMDGGRLVPCWQSVVMSTAWGLTIDCARPRELAAFWALALGYVEPLLPRGAPSWEAWLAEQGVPEDEWDDGAYLVDPSSVLGLVPSSVMPGIAAGMSASCGRELDNRERAREPSAEPACLPGKRTPSAGAA
jgi:hypothetical protein